jgi:hypothetical protein
MCELTIGSQVRVYAVLGAVLLLVASGGVRADDAKADHKESTGQARAEVRQRADESSVVTIGAMRVAVDPKTGDLRPLTPAEARKLADEMRRLFKPRELTAPTQRPDGALSAAHGIANNQPTGLPPMG